MLASPLHLGPLPASNIELLDGTEQVTPSLNLGNDRRIRGTPVLSGDDSRSHNIAASSYEDVPPEVLERFVAAASDGSGEDVLDIWAQTYRDSWRSARDTWK